MYRQKSSRVEWSWNYGRRSQLMLSLGNARWGHRRPINREESMRYAKRLFSINSLHGIRNRFHLSSELLSSFYLMNHEATLAHVIKWSKQAAAEGKKSMRVHSLVRLPFDTNTAETRAELYAMHRRLKYWRRCLCLCSIATTIIFSVDVRKYLFNQLIVFFIVVAFVY